MLFPRQFDWPTTHEAAIGEKKTGNSKMNRFGQGALSASVANPGNSFRLARTGVVANGRAAL